jgi:hypothetical protein
MKIVKKILFLFAFAIVAGLVFLGFKNPKIDSNWVEKQAVVPKAEIKGNIVEFTNFRDFTYTPDLKMNIKFKDYSLNINDIEGVDFIISYFSEYDWIAHTLLSFRIKGQEPVSFSIEARYDNNEEYDPVDGMFRNYELYYVIAAERDILGVRTHIRKKGKGERVYLYNLKYTAEEAQKIFLEYCKNMNNLINEPDFYNTITNNCTTGLLENIESALDINLNWSIKWQLAGYIDEYLYDNAMVDTTLSFENLKKQAYINPKKTLYTNKYFYKEVRQK